MHRIDWTTALLRVLAVWILFSTLAGLGPFLRITMQHLDTDLPLNLAVLAASIAVPALSAAALWRWAQAIARLIWRGPAPPDVGVPAPISASEFQQALLVLLGVWFGVSGLIDLAYVAVAANSRSTFGTAYSQGDFLAQGLWTAFQVSAGMLLIVGARALVQALKRVRTLGLRPDA